MVLIRIRNKNTNKTYNNTGDGLTDTITTTPIADCPAMSFVFGCCLSTNKYQKYKSVELPLIFTPTLISTGIPPP